MLKFNGKLRKSYNMYDGFSVKVKSVDGQRKISLSYQQLVATKLVGLLTRTNVALSRAK